MLTPPKFLHIQNGLETSGPPIARKMATMTPRYRRRAACPLYMQRNDNKLYESWLQGGSDPVPSREISHDSVILFLSPHPWTFCLAAGLAVSDKAHPVIVLKNPAPFAEFENLKGFNRKAFFNFELEMIIRRLLVHNPGIEGALNSLLNDQADNILGPETIL